MGLVGRISARFMAIARRCINYGSKILAEKRITFIYKDIHNKRDENK